MKPTNNRQIRLIRRPQGMPEPDDFLITEEPVPQPGNGEVLVRTVYLSVDPYMRGRMRDVKSYVPPFPLNEVLTGGVVGQVVESRHPDYQTGDLVTGMLEWADYSVSTGEKLNKIPEGPAPASAALSVLGMPGLTAYFGLLDIGKPQAGETVVVSGAAGAVGSIVGQIAKLKGCQVVGIAGSREKVDYLTKELGFDAVINYREESVPEALDKVCPKGVDVYFDNVGGPISDAVLARINYQARIPLCGQISLYNQENPEPGPRVQGALLINSALMKGFIVSDYQEHFQEGMAQLSQWVGEGKIRYRENIVDGLENTIAAFQGLFKGENIGKQLVRVS
ncbi:NADP-dependent oxidoreductase [Kroppenstedtia pulmonis]|uniref:NADP-dependent oxidoreductase n=1 Tax=Kroppenstedtia pulmonis TaxID=1380685 RepID=A0A7D4BIS8_9BACL|nr:NADP-dependent oxidoreductase [Kroppenstedtia pulmonis]QKG83850.1 NADP-dependent oxidoreductase [Kroppenstedtia pulmonis]